ncbi:fibroin heavy chain-like [Cydia splendana]|uniref:fibroin heavy chain-like n=1 Tax=Cydia splendana TaxID=1100963 RepID=UPI00300DBC5C
MRATTLVILCCAVAYAGAQQVDEDDALAAIWNLESQMSETAFDKKDSVSVENGTTYEKQTTRKEFHRQVAKPNVSGEDKIVRTFVIETDADGQETIYEEDVVIHKVPGGESTSTTTGRRAISGFGGSSASSNAAASAGARPGPQSGSASSSANAAALAQSGPQRPSGPRGLSGPQGPYGPQKGPQGINICSIKVTVHFQQQQHYHSFYYGN